jgi:tRNA(Ile)-lysidine synthetase-like protein
VQAAEANQLKSLDGIPRLAVALSGGGDSMAMLRLLLERRAAHSIVALTVDHQLRETSAAEANQVSVWCKSLRVEHITLKWQHEKITTGIQAKARKARYDLMTAWCFENNVPVLVTAHTIEDQAETVAMRQRRTTSVKSLSGIWPETEWNGIRILRPLLNQRREDLRSYLKSIDQAWIEDPSNKDERFERIRIRNSNPKNNLAEIASASQAEVRLAQDAVTKWFAANVTFEQAQTAAINRQNFCEQPALQQDMIISTICQGQTELAERRRLCAWIAETGQSRRNLGGIIFNKRKLQILTKPEPARRQKTQVMLNQQAKNIVHSTK